MKSTSLLSINIVPQLNSLVLGFKCSDNDNRELVSNSMVITNLSSIDTLVNPFVRRGTFSLSSSHEQQLLAMLAENELDHEQFVQQIHEYSAILGHSRAEDYVG
jgi:hypothetical protein